MRNTTSSWTNTYYLSCLPSPRTTSATCAGHGTSGAGLSAEK